MYIPNYINLSVLNNVICCIFISIPLCEFKWLFAISGCCHGNYEVIYLKTGPATPIFIS